MTERQRAINIVFNAQKGTKVELENLIGPKFFKQFCLMGFISQGASKIENDAVKTWSITDRGRDFHDFYAAPSKEDIKMSLFCSSIGI